MYPDITRMATMSACDTAITRAMFKNTQHIQSFSSHLRANTVLICQIYKFFKKYCVLSQNSSLGVCRKETTQILVSDFTHTNTTLTALCWLSCANSMWHSWWKHEWEPARPSILRQAGGDWENRGVSATGTASSLWAPWINNPALMQHGTARPGLAKACQTGLR